MGRDDYSFRQSVTLPDHEHGTQPGETCSEGLEYEATIYVSGENKPATHSSPAEYQTFDIEEIPPCEVCGHEWTIEELEGIREAALERRFEEEQFARDEALENHDPSDNEE